VSPAGSLSIDAKVSLLRDAVRARPSAPALLWELSSALFEAGREDESAETFERAFLLEPHHLFTFDEIQRSPAAALRRARSLADHAVIFTPVLSTIAIAESLLDRPERVRELVDYEAFFRTAIIDAPSGGSIAEFNALLAKELKSEMHRYEDPTDRAIRSAWRNNNPFDPANEAGSALAVALRSEVEAYRLGLPRESGNLFVRSTPRDFVIEGWAVISDPASHHVSHIHQRAWLSGVYYVVGPPSSASNHVGWLRVGPPHEAGVSSGQGWDEVLVKPDPGRLILMPGYFFHETQAMGVQDERICVAFDVVPAEITA
jgi:Putative 2OG-Fe(II) oxygenase